MYKLVYTTNKDMEKYLNQDFDVYIEKNLVAINKDNKGFSTSEIKDSTALIEAGIMVRTKNSIYMFAYVNPNFVSDYSGF